MSEAVAEKRSAAEGRLPEWLRQELPDAQKLKDMRAFLRERHLHTVCESACCPNSGKCFNAGVVTVMILGNACTRRCGFCAVGKAGPAAVDAGEPENVAGLVEHLKLRYVVVTSVTRDDLPDGGAEHFAQTIRAIRRRRPDTKIEVLIPDFGGALENLEAVAAAGPDVIGHNLEMARRLFPAIRPQADYDRSLNVLRSIKRLRVSLAVKSGFMAGLGETDEEIRGMLEDLAAAGCNIVTIGQYLAPSKDHVPVARFVRPQDFKRYEEWGKAAGIPAVVSGPLVRSSYLAETVFDKFMEQIKK